MSKVKKFEDVELPLQQGQTKDMPFTTPQVDKEGDAIVDLLKLIQGHLKAIEHNTFKGY
jgi:hypothetical protein